MGILQDIIILWKWSGIFFFLVIVGSYGFWLLSDVDEIKGHPALKVCVLSIVLLLAWLIFWAIKGLMCT